MPTPCNVVPYAGVPGICAKCGKPLPEKRRRWCSRLCAQRYRRSHTWNLARAAARRRDKYRCVKCGKGRDEVRLEVNHIVPLLGRGYSWGCEHHLSNLETVCHACHLAITRAQREERRLAS